MFQKIQKFYKLPVPHNIFTLHLQFSQRLAGFNPAWMKAQF